MASILPVGKRRLERTALPAILLLALLLRLPGHFHAASLHFDEGMEIAAVVNSFPPSGSLRHPFLNRYLVFAAETVYYGVGRLSGSFGSTSEFGERFEADPRVFLYVARSVCMIAGLLTVFLVYRLGERVWSRTVGLGGALLLAVSPGHILVSNNLRGWSLGTCLATLTLLFAVRMVSSRERRFVLLAGLAAGFAVASVYILGLLLLPLACALWARRRVPPAPRSVLHGGMDALRVLAGMSAGFLAGNVGAFLRGEEVFRVLRLVSERDAAYSLGDYFANAAQYTGSLAGDFGMGSVLACISALGVFIACVRRPRGWWVLFSFALCVLVLQPARLYLWAGRYVVPAYPVLLLAASSGLAAACRFLVRVWPGSARVPVFATALFLLVTLNLIPVAHYVHAARKTPTRELARRWIEENIPAGTGIVLTMQHVSPALRAIQESDDGNPSVGRERPGFNLVYLPLWTQPTVEEQANAFQDSIAALARRGFTHVVFTDPVPPSERLRRKEANFEKMVLDRDHALVRRFLHDDVRKLPDDTALVNPEVRIYRLRT